MSMVIAIGLVIVLAIHAWFAVDMFRSERRADIESALHREYMYGATLTGRTARRVERLRAEGRVSQGRLR
jgi:hypothetical protein